MEGIEVAVFAPHDTEIVEHWSGVFLLQEGHAREEDLRERFASTGNIEFNMYDFTQSNEDDSIVSEIFNREVAMLSDMSSSSRDPLTVSQARPRPPRLRRVSLQRLAGGWRRSRPRHHRHPPHLLGA